jgi:MFS family permease
MRCVLSRLGLVELLASGRGRVLWFCFLGWVFDFHDLILFSFCKRTIAQDLALDPSSVAWIEGLSLFASALGGIAFGRMADRVGRRRAMTASILVYCAGALCTAAADGPWMLAFARVLAGLGVGGEWGIGHAVVHETFEGKDRDRAHGLLQAGGPLGMALAACTGLFLAPEIGWRSAFLLSGLPALLVFFARRAMPGPDAPPVRERVDAPLRALFGRERRRATWTLLAILTLHMTGFWCVYAEMPNALMRDFSASAADAGRYQISVNAVHLIADVAFGWLAARFGRGRVFVAFCLFFAGAQFAMAACWDSFTQSLVAFSVGAAAMGFGAGTWSCFGALFGICYPPALRATAAAVLYSCSRGAQLFAKPMSHALAEWHGSLQPALWIGASCALGSALLYGALPREADVAGSQCQSDGLSGGRGAS